MMLLKLGALSSLLGHLTHQTTHVVIEVTNKEHGGSGYGNIQPSTLGDPYASMTYSFMEMKFSEDHPTYVFTSFELRYILICL